MNLFVEPIASPAHDDMLARMSGERVVAVGKDLSPMLAHHRSLGFVAWRGADARHYVDALGEVIGGVDGTQAFHHAVVNRIAHDGTVHAVSFEGGAWTEIDRPEDIAAWGGIGHRAHGGEASKAAGF
jgi:choline kinase